MKRISWAIAIALSSFCMNLASGCQSAHAAEAPLVSAVGCISFTVSDLDRSLDFYERVLHFKRGAIVEESGEALEHLTGVFGARTRTARMTLGSECIEPREFLAPRGRAIPEDSRSNDRWFQHLAIVVSDLDRVYAELRAAKVEHASTGPQTLPLSNPNAGGIRAFYFKDPDHHVLEAIWFPKGKGDARWQDARGELFLGIDHTAIVSSDTEASLAFWRDTLGLRVVGTSENSGVEQEHLNNVFGARLRITTLHAASGPGVELLEYLAPRDGRAYPADAHANDLVHWHTRLVTNDPAHAEQVLRAKHATFLSSGVVTAPAPALDAGHDALVRDPDGHAAELVSP